MGTRDDTPKLNRRSFLKTSTAAAGAAIIGAGIAAQKTTSAADDYDHRNERPERMQYRKLGRTNLMCSALVFGCGSALTDGKAVRLLERAYEQGVNHFDVGRTYKGSEAAMAPFLKHHRGDIWVTSKAPVRTSEELGPDDPLTVDYAKGAMRYWEQQLDDSLKALDTDYVDAYYLMGVNHAGFLKSEETATAFLKAKEAGKVGHFGISTHERAHECLEAAIEAGWYSLAMIGITPAGWYDYRDLQLRKGTLNLKQLRPLLDQAREAGIGLVGMKAALHIALNARGATNREAQKQTVSATAVFDEHYDEKLMQAPFSPFQRSYAYVLENGLDVVNSDMHNFKHFEENVVAARTSHEYFA